jgi:3-oxoacyl-[acyl-carrier protein] reductase
MAITISFEKQVALVTGGASGIGRACVRAFAEAGAKTVFTYNTNDREAEDLVNELGKYSVYGFKVDLLQEQDIINKVNAIRSSFGKIDILVNNAGVWKRGNFAHTSLADWEETIDINLNGTFLITREVVKIMEMYKFGRIINIASTAGQRGEAHYSHYAASKGALISLTKSLAAELAASNITVNCVAPGWVLTKMTESFFADPLVKEEIEKNIPLGKIAVPEDIAGPVLFLASSLAGHITGEILNVNGGSVLCG